MLTYAYVVYPWLMLIDKIDGKDARLSDNEARILCFFHSFYRNNLPIHPTKTQIAEALFFRVESGKTQPSTIRRGLKGLQDKGYICVTEKGNSKGSANCYEFCPGRTLWDLFQIVDKENPGALSDGQRQIAKADLSPVTSQAPGSRDNITGKEVKCSTQEPVKHATKKAEKKQAKASVPTVDANGWENRPEDLRAKANYLWKTKLKNMKGKRVAITTLRDELRGSEADCKQSRPDKYWTLGKFDFDFIQMLKKNGVNVVANGYDVFKGEPFTQGDSFKNLKVTHYIDDNGKYRQDLEFIEKVIDVVPDLM